MKLFLACVMGYVIMGCLNIMLHLSSFSYKNMEVVAKRLQRWESDKGEEITPIDRMIKQARKGALISAFLLWPLRLFFRWPEPKNSNG